jgi:hypothetical protein
MMRKRNENIDAAIESFLAEERSVIVLKRRGRDEKIAAAVAFRRLE